MSSGVRRLASAVAQSPKKSPSPAGLGSAVKLYGATFITSEAVDANLSRIQVGNSTFRYVPRLANAWSSPPGQGTTILVASLGGSLVILGAQIGDTSKATYP